jgi:hypothetical protein
MPPESEITNRLASVRSKVAKLAKQSGGSYEYFL